MNGSWTDNLKKFPVAWLAGAAIVVGALLEADAQFHVLPGTIGHWLGYVAAVLGLIVAATKAHGAVTPLADPKTPDGDPAVLVSKDDLAQAAIDRANSQPPTG
jgi:hypothetical protein